MSDRGRIYKCTLECESLKTLDQWCATTVYLPPPPPQSVFYKNSCTSFFFLGGGKKCNGAPRIILFRGLAYCRLLLVSNQDCRKGFFFSFHSMERAKSDRYLHVFCKDCKDWQEQSCNMPEGALKIFSGADSECFMFGI